MQLESTIITSISTLLAVAITFFFTNKREKAKFKQDIQLQNLNKLENLYIDIISSINKAIKYTKFNKDYSELFNEMSNTSATANLLLPKTINIQFAKTSNSLFEWSSVYRKGLPTKIGDTGYGIVSNMDSKYKNQANDLYLNLQKDIELLIKMIKHELSNKRKLI